MGHVCANNFCHRAVGTDCGANWVYCIYQCQSSVPAQDLNNFNTIGYIGLTCFDMFIYNLLVVEIIYIQQYNVL